MPPPPLPVTLNQNLLEHSDHSRYILSQDWQKFIQTENKPTGPGISRGTKAQGSGVVKYMGLGAEWFLLFCNDVSIKSVSSSTVT